MTCEDSVELLSARLDGALTEEENRALENHLKICTECRAVAEDLEAIHLSFEDMEPVPAPDGFARDVMAKLEAPKVVPLFRRPAFKAVAGLAACLVLCVGLWQGVSSQKQQLPAEARAGTYVMEAQTTCTLDRLPEGTGLEHADWTVEQDGSRTLLLSTEQLESVEKLARVQKISFHLEGEIASAQSVLLRVTGKG